MASLPCFQPFELLHLAEAYWTYRTHRTCSALATPASVASRLAHSQALPYLALARRPLLASLLEAHMAQVPPSSQSTSHAWNACHWVSVEASLLLLRSMAVAKAHRTAHVDVCSCRQICTNHCWQRIYKSPRQRMNHS